MNYTILFILIRLLSAPAPQQDTKGPVAKFDFNNGSDYDEISKRKAKLVGASHAPDRFGNKNSAIYTYGNASSYVNLGNYKALKPLVGSISIWAKLEAEVWSGKGREMNSIIITKNCKGDDFYEAYNISYFLDCKKISALCTQDSLAQIAISSIEKFDLFRWHHLVITYDNDFFAFYIDGKVEKKLPKNFETKFLESDSVIVGVTANKKNNRFSHGTFDDIAFYDRVLTDSEVNDLYHAPNPNINSIILNRVLIGAAVIALLLIIFLYIRYRIRLTMKKEKQRLESQNTLLETELRVNRALMNPHFIFNSLNGLQDFILKNQNDEAYNYLIKFSQHLRKIIENNTSDSISLELEIEILNQYIDIEGMRFEEDFMHAITVDPVIVPSATFIPIMMLQPFVENAIWHGLLNKEGEKVMNISFLSHENKYLECTIEDNGLGRANSNTDHRNKKSMATLFVRQRLDLLNKIHSLKCSLLIEDKPDNKGTIIKIMLPILNG